MRMPKRYRECAVDATAPLLRDACSPFRTFVFTCKVRAAQIAQLHPVLHSAIPAKTDIVRPIAEVFGKIQSIHGAENDFEAAAEPRTSSRAFDESPLDARMLDLDRDDEGESPFLRGQKRVPVRR